MVKKCPPLGAGSVDFCALNEALAKPNADPAAAIAAATTKVEPKPKAAAPAARIAPKPAAKAGDSI